MRRVLVIEDDSDMREAYLEFLEMSGYLVDTAASGAEGRELAFRNRPAAILLDVSLPDIDGCTLRDELLRTDAMRGVPIIAVTGHSLDSEEKVGFAAVFVKPVALSALASCLDELLGSNRSPSPQQPARPLG